MTKNFRVENIDNFKQSVKWVEKRINDILSDFWKVLITAIQKLRMVFTGKRK